MKNRPKSNLSGFERQRPDGAKSPNGKNDEPKALFKIIIEQLDNGTSRHIIPKGVPLEHFRDMLFKHMMLIQEQITTIHIEQKMQQVEIIKPGQIPPGMKLHS